MRFLGMVGATYRGHGQDFLAALAGPPGSLADARLQQLHRRCDFEESCLLQTCNRVEVVFVGRPGVDCAEYRRRLHAHWLPEQPATSAARHLHAYAGEGAAERLFLVASALDSLQLGEAQVLGQVKQAYQRARRLGLAGPQLATVFEEAFAVAKRVRRQTGLGEGSTSMVSLARGVIDARLAASPAGQRQVAVVGTGTMGAQAAEMFGGRPDLLLRLVSRSPGPAAALAARTGGRPESLADFLAAPGLVDVMVTATGAPAPLFGPDFFRRLGRPSPLVVDLNVAHDVAPAAATALGVELWDIDKLAHLAAGNRQRRRGHLASARALVDEALEASRRRQLARDLAPAVTSLRAWLDASLAAALPALPGPAGERDPQALDAWAALTARRLAHPSTLALRALGLAHGPEAVATFVEALARPPGGAGGGLS